MPNSIYCEVLHVGGTGGEPFAAFGSWLSFVETLKVWKGSYENHHIIKALQVGFSDGLIQHYGNRQGSDPKDEHTYTFKPGERIVSLCLWGDGHGKRAGKISFDTNMDGHFDTGDCNATNSYPVTELGSGLLVGLEGRSKADIDEIGFKFIKKITSVVLTDVQYPKLPEDDHSIQPVYIDSFEDTNGLKTPKDWVFEGKVSKAVSHKWSTSCRTETTTEVHVSAGKPEVFNIGGKYVWVVSKEHTEEISSDTTKELSWSNSGTLAPGGHIRLTAVTHSGFLPALGYSGTITVTTSDGCVQIFKDVPGTFTTVDFTAIEVKTQEAYTAMRIGDRGLSTEYVLETKAMVTGAAPSRRNAAHDLQPGAV